MGTAKSTSVVGKRLRQARLRAGLSQKKLGILAGIDEFTASARINQYEQGTHTPRYITVERLSKVLGIPTPYMYCREDDLAHWILAHEITPSRVRDQIIKKITNKQTSNFMTSPTSESCCCNDHGVQPHA